MSSGSWPASLLLVRHGESAGNVARDAAEANGDLVIAIDERDMDVDLSEAGERQARSLGRWLAGLDDPPVVALASPYVRARRTLELAIETSGLAIEATHDERLREREFGALDRLTRRGIEERFPEEAEARSRLGKFYHRPPGGESWADVGLRVRSVVDSLARQHAGETVLLVAHQVVILMFRYVLEQMDEQQVLATSRDDELLNCSVTSFVHDPSMGRSGGMRLVRFNEAVALEDGAPVTAEAPGPAADGAAPEAADR